MNNKKNGIPKLRFPGFTGAWEQRKLGEVADVIDPHPSHRAPAEVKIGIPFIGISDVNEIGEINYSTVRVVDEDIYEEHHRRYDLSIPSLGIGRVASLGKVIRLRNDIGKYAISPTMSVLQPDTRIEINYLYSYMNSSQFQKQFSAKSNGSTRQSVGIKDLRTLVVSVPSSSNEQQKIGEYFSKFDSLIALHQRKLEHLQEQKKGLLQKMFPKKGETVPEVRFPGFTDAWEQRKLGGVAKFYSGGTPSVGVSDYYDGTIPFIRSAEINSTSTELYLSELGLQNSSAKMVHRGDILYALYGATSGEVGISKINGAINQAILAIIPHKGYNSEFLEQWLRKNKEAIIKTYLQGGQGNLSGAIVKQIKVSFPSFDEQQKIGKSFQKIDSLITLHQRKLDHLELMKKGLLQQMFV